MGVKKLITDGAYLIYQALCLKIANSYLVGSRCDVEYRGVHLVVTELVREVAGVDGRAVVDTEVGVPAVAGRTLMVLTKVTWFPKPK